MKKAWGKEFLLRAWDFLRVAEAMPQYRFDSAPRPIDQVIGEMLSATGRISRADALSVTAVLRGRNLICSIATLPLVQYGPDLNIVRLSLLEQIDPDVPNSVTLAQTIEDLLFEGVAWWRITNFGFDGFPTSARHINHNSVSLQPPGGRSQSPLPAGYDPRGAVVYVDGEEVPWSEVIRFDSPNPALLVSAGRAIRRALRLDQAAALYTDNPRPLDYFTPNPDADEADDDEVQQILSDWQSARKKRSTAYIPKALQYNSVDVPTPADLQLVELQRKVTLDIANALGLDPEDLGISTTSRTYQNVTDRRQDRINDVLSPYMHAITDRLSMRDVTKRGYKVEFDLDDYMRADPTTRWNNYKTAKELGAITVDEIRTEENMPQLTNAQRREIAPTPSADAAPTPNNVVALRPTSVGFNGPEHTFINVPVAQFKVDREGRTIEGLALPYNQVAEKFGMKFRFAPGALQYGDTSRVKLLRDHDYTQAIGRMVQADDKPDGVFVKYKVARGAEGDQALSLAEDGVLDGFSVGIDFDIANDTVPDPDNKGVTLIRRADWRETSLTAMPAFDDARVTKVAASRTGGTMDPCGTCGQIHAPGVACQTNSVPETAPAGFMLTQEQLAAALARPEGIQALQALLAPEQRQVVNPTRVTASLTVNEPPPYRFDRKGNLQRGSHDFSQDLFAASKGDQTAYKRAMEFVQAQFDVVTTDVDELNPTRQRPDLYVDQRTFQYPLWTAIEKGTLTDVTPFTFPKFSSAGSMVANHTQGVEPASGTFVTTSATVTPTPVSGKMKISRETWDQGGNPQVSNLIWRQMQKAWYEALEAFAVTTLDASSPTAIDFSATPGLANDDLDQALTAAFAALQFVRGGFSMDNMFTQIDLYKALVAAVGQDGRRLYPAIGPTNANGNVRARYAALDINGVIAYPAWALAASGTVAANSYLFDTDAVYGWASAPQRLDITMTEVANVYIGLWGYKAAVISDINGVRRVIFDPV